MTLSRLGLRLSSLSSHSLGQSFCRKNWVHSIVVNRSGGHCSGGPLTSRLSKSVSDSIGNENLHWGQPDGSGAGDVSGCGGDRVGSVVPGDYPWNREGTHEARKQKERKKVKHV